MIPDTLNELPQKLRETLAYVQAHSPYYKELFARANIHTENIVTSADFRKIPTTDKVQLFSRNADFLCVAKSDIREYVTTSGTLGDPVWIALTENDLQRLGKNEAFSYELAQITENDIIQLTTTLDKRFMAGMAYWLGAREHKTAIIRTGPGIPEMQWDTIHRMRSTVLIAVPSFLLKMIEFAEQHGIKPNESGIKKVICIGESLRNSDLSDNALALRIKEKWDIQLFGTYASTEMATAYTECYAGQGGHFNTNLIFTECLDEDGNPVAEGETGEITITTFGVEGMPFLRFRTGDMVRVHTAPCPCGRNTPRLGPVEGRKQQMIKYRGTTLYPPAIFDILNSVPQIENYIVELRHNDIGTDEIFIRVALKSEAEDFEKILKDKFRAKLRVAPQILFDSAANIHAARWPEGNRKPKLLADYRK